MGVKRIKIAENRFEHDEVSLSHTKKPWKCMETQEMAHKSMKMPANACNVQNKGENQRDNANVDFD